MPKYSKICLFTGCFFIIFLISVNGETINLFRFVNDRNAELEWEPVRDTARIIKNNRWIVLKIDSPFFLMDGDIYPAEENIYRSDSGSILIPETIAAKISGFLETEQENTVSEDSNRIAVILLDPGHGGKDPGAVGRHPDSLTVNEKDIVLDVSKRVRELLMENYPSKQILLTRNTDTYITLEQRTEMANSIKLEENEAIIFISIHANASLSNSGHGFEIWYLPPEYKREVIDEESLQPEYLEIKDILNEMLDAEYTLESVLLAKEIELGLNEQAGEITRNRGIKEEKWFVVRKSKMPSVLIELGFVTNYEEAVRMSSPDYLQSLAVGIYNGINNFIKKYEETKGFTE